MSPIGAQVSGIEAMAYYWVPRRGDHDDQDRHGGSDQPQPTPKLMCQKYAGADGDMDAEWIGYVPKYTYPKSEREGDECVFEGHELQTRPMMTMGYNYFAHSGAGSKWGRYGGGNSDYLGGSEKAGTGSPVESGSDEIPMSQQAIEVRGQILLIELELSAWMALEEVAETEDDPAVKESVVLAQRYLKCPSQSTLSAALALHEISNSVAEMGPSPTQEKLVEVEKAVRDVVVCRCQLATEFGVRHLFVRELQKVFDYPKLDSNARSKLMHSHRTIFGDWPGVFKSHCTAHAKQRSLRKSEKQQLKRSMVGGYEDWGFAKLGGGETLECLNNNVVDKAETGMPRPPPGMHPRR